LVHEDVAALDALAIVLGHGEASRLHRAMKRDRLLCTEVQASCYTPVDPGLTIVGLTLQPASAREAVREALAQTYRLRSEEVTAEELSIACRLLEGDAVYQRETVQGQARKLGFYQSSASGVEFEQRYLEQVARLTPVRLRDAAERWIDPSAALRAAWRGGLRAEDASNAGINMLLARLVSKGTQTRAAERLVREMEAMGGSIGGNAGRNSFGMRAEFLSRHLAEGFDVFADAIS